MWMERIRVHVFVCMMTVYIYTLKSANWARDSILKCVLMKEWGEYRGCLSGSYRGRKGKRNEKVQSEGGHTDSVRYSSYLLWI